MKQLVAVGVLALFAVGCTTTGTRIDNTISEYQAPPETAAERNAKRPELSQWCDSYKESVRGLTITCSMTEDVFVFYTRLKPRYEWTRDGVSSVIANFEAWGCDTLKPELELGFAMVTQLTNTTHYNFTTIEDCNI